MERLIKKWLRNYESRQRGFTVIELLIAVTILGIITAVIIPNLSSFFGIANLGAASTELEYVKAAAAGYYGEHQIWPADSRVLTSFITRNPRATYVFDTTTGLVIGVSDMTWSGIIWSSPSGPPYSQNGWWTK